MLLSGTSGRLLAEEPLRKLHRFLSDELGPGELREAQVRCLERSHVGVPKWFKRRPRCC